MDEATQQQFLVDTGSSYSIIPHRSQEPTSGPHLCIADCSPISYWGDCKLHRAAGGRRFTWLFLLADGALPNIGAEFLHHFGLLVDLGEMQLLARMGSLSQQLVAPSGNGMFATIGVVADQPPQHVEAAPAARASTSPSLHTVEARGSSSSLQHMLDEFPSVLNTSKVFPNHTHRVEPFLVTEGCPVTAKYRRLDNDRLEAAKKEFAELEKQGTIRRSSSNWASPLHRQMAHGGHVETTGCSTCRRSQTSTHAPTLRI